MYLSRIIHNNIQFFYKGPNFKNEMIRASKQLLKKLSPLTIIKFSSIQLNGQLEAVITMLKSKFTNYKYKLVKNREKR